MSRNTALNLSQLSQSNQPAERSFYFKTFVSLLFFFCLFSIQSVTAQWHTDPTINTPVCLAADQQEELKMVSDGNGGAIITWQDQRNSSGILSIYAQRVNAAGVVLWTVNGEVISAAPGGVTFYPAIIGDGSGGAIITWEDQRNTDVDIYAQRINASGVVQWGTNGVAVCTATGEQHNPVIASDGSGGAIITWQDLRSIPDYHIYAQRISAAGVMQWPANGVLVCTPSTDSEQSYPSIASDGAGGAIISFNVTDQGDLFTGVGIYAQRMNASGALQWNANGIRISDELSDQFSSSTISDGAGGAIVIWNDDRHIINEIYAQRINSSGSRQWDTSGIRTSDILLNQYLPALTSDGSGGVIITWQDFRSGIDDDIYAQRINSSGATQWTSNGIAVCTATNDQSYPAITGDGTGGAIITWHDRRGFPTSDFNIYAQRMNASGTTQWATDGVAASLATGGQLYPVIIDDGNGAAIISWQDTRGGNFHIYAQMINADGTLAGSCPASGVWVGQISTDWSNAANWCGGAVPQSNTAVVIPGGTPYSPVLNANATVKSLTINAGATLTVNAPYTLTVLTN